MALRIAVPKYVMVTMPSSSPTFVQAIEDGGDEVSAVQLRDVYKSFGSVQAVCGVDLTIRTGEILAFLGPNGAGKTSTIDIILGLSQPSSGDVKIYGMKPRQAITKGLVSAVLQTGGLLKDLTVGETVAYTSKLFAVSRPVTEIMERAGIAGITGMAKANALPGPGMAKVFLRSASWALRVMAWPSRLIPRFTKRPGGISRIKRRNCSTLST